MYTYYLWFTLLLIACSALSINASNKVNKTFSALREMPARSRMTGYDTAVRLLRAGGVQGISVGRVKGTLTDHFHPAKRQVNLSNGVYGDNSVAAIAVAAHEIGHVMQKEKGYEIISHILHNIAILYLQ
jgi:Zn-dependent membrane protease YugP